LAKLIDGIRKGLREAMQADPEVFLLGEDVAVGGPFGATAGLLEAFGPDRVLNTPISEDTIMGVAVGAALARKRPVVEIMFADFITLAMNQLVGHAAKLRYMSGGQLSVPMVIRLQQGALGAWGAHHSQSFEAWLAHVPGLKVVAPSNAEDARALLRAAIEDEDPVVFLEHRALYFRDESEAGQHAGPTLGARVVRTGTDVTIAGYLRSALDAAEAARALESQGVSAEVIDLRWLSPLDMNTLLASVTKTHRLVIAHEAVASGGLGAEIAACVQTEAFDELDAPIERVAAPFSPVPASPALEEAFVPGAGAIVRAALHTLGR